MKVPLHIDKCNRFIERLMNIMGDTTKGDILIIGGGISGISAAVEIAEFGHHVTIVEKNLHLVDVWPDHINTFQNFAPLIAGWKFIISAFGAIRILILSRWVKWKKLTVPLAILMYLLELPPVM